MSHEITWLFVYGSPRVIIFTSEVIFMVFVGIDVAKDKHDLYAVDSDGLSSAITSPSQIQPPALHHSWSGFLFGAK